MKIFKIILLLILITLGNLEAKIQSIQTRDDIELLFDLIKPENTDEPIASVILFTGGSGYLKMNEEKWRKNGNFLVRSRKIFRDNNFAVAVVNAPSDYRSSGMPAEFRTSEKHLEDINALIKFMKDKFNKPVWLIGTSRGTLSATYIAINSK